MHLKKSPINNFNGIKKIVAFGFGSYDTVFHHDHERQEQLNLIVARHHAIQDLQTIIEKTGEGHKVRVFLQDEAFTKKDKENLAKLQFEALYDPDGYLQIDKNTLVVIFDKEPDNAVMQVIADIAETESIVKPKNQQ